MTMPGHKISDREHASGAFGCIDPVVETHARWIRMATLVRAIEDRADGNVGVSQLAIRLTKEIEAASPGVFEAAAVESREPAVRRSLSDLGVTADVVFLGDDEMGDVYR